MSLDLTDDKSTLVQVMAQCRQATSHYLSQCWPRSLSPYGFTRLQCVNNLIIKETENFNAYLTWWLSINKFCGAYSRSLWGSCVFNYYHWNQSHHLKHYSWEQKPCWQLISDWGFNAWSTLWFHLPKDKGGSDHAGEAIEIWLCKNVSDNMMDYGDVTGVLWHLKAPATWLFVQ